MKIILLKDVKGVGRKYEEKIVSDGFAQNKLIPQKLAVSAAGGAAGQIKNLKEGEAKRQQIELDKQGLHMAKLAGTTISVSMKANEKNHLFAALTPDKIAQILAGQGIEVSADMIDLKTPIKETGTFSVPVLMGSQKTKFTLEVLPA